MKCLRAVRSRVMLSVCVLTGVTFLSSCTHHQKNQTLVFTCANIDWWEIGRADGASGLPATKVQEHQSRCDSTPTPVDAQLYANGRDAGLIEYCSATRGLEMGRNGSTYEGVCPEHLEQKFVMNYERGRRIISLERENLELDQKIQELLRQAVSTNQSTSPLRLQLEQLRAQRDQNALEISQLEVSTKQL
jgi:hypothetical protein